MTAVTVRSEFQFDRWSVTTPFPPHLYPPPSHHRASRVDRWYPDRFTACEWAEPVSWSKKHTHTHHTHTTHTPRTHHTHTTHTYTHTTHTPTHTTHTPQTHTPHTPHTHTPTHTTQPPTHTTNPHTHTTHTPHTHTPHTHTHIHTVTDAFH